MDPQIIAFALVATVVTVLPGADMALVARAVLANGPRTGYVMSAGVCTGLWVHAVDSVLARSLLLAAIHVVIGLVWLITYAYFLSRLSTVLKKRRVRQALEGVTGAVLVALGVRLAWSRR